MDYLKDFGATLHRNNNTQACKSPVKTFAPGRSDQLLNKSCNNLCNILFNRKVLVLNYTSAELILIFHNYR